MFRRCFFLRDHRDNIIRIFQEMADLNNALGEKYKVASYNRSIESLKTNLDKPLNTPADIKAFPGFGSKLLKKAEEIMETGKLEELEKKTKPKLKAIQELTQVHGFGPRAAAALFDREGIFTVEELLQKADSIPSLTDQQRVGIKYFYDINEKIPMQESVLHENFLREKCTEALGKEFDIQICGSYRRRHPFSGDVDAILSRTLDAPPISGPVAATGALAQYCTYLQGKNYLEATMAQGPLKYMGMGRLPSRVVKDKSGRESTKIYKARRVDIRLIETKSVPTALLTFTGSKNFNVIMRQAAISKGFLLNEYGLFALGTPEEARELYERIGNKGKNAGEELGVPKEELEAKRVEVKSEQDVFDALGMPYAKPENRDP
ncbi:DNA polymerase beta subunit [Angomonas deanei]|uniref:DNA polymerase n=1 Tax=Angomonas deanei TaxID=59799 RepID=S9VWI7_9TRYP|nr:DNA polymerase beta subunit [Angomonas deanei]EPY41263.1 DNA polymerase beta subunit [Angomonas deanei]EPY43513.1 DNA polymerase beta subunit [Angomonas deanei]CAD2217078.1 Helix-hairpin-helix domain/Fingers domain of DNA polymerase lambda/DNA polymerase beta palm/DNA polymerase beta thumb, putative [Angomonas deanei]|eukprot:EPY31426.1 DNA polymerase beta subunit [Angomonas deanei]